MHSTFLSVYIYKIDIGNQTQQNKTNKIKQKKTNTQSSRKEYHNYMSAIINQPNNNK